MPPPPAYPPPAVLSFAISPLCRREILEQITGNARQRCQTSSAFYFANAFYFRGTTSGGRLLSRFLLSDNNWSTHTHTHTHTYTEMFIAPLRLPNQYLTHPTESKKEIKRRRNATLFSGELNDRAQFRFHDHPLRLRSVNARYTTLASPENIYANCRSQTHKIT